MGLNVNNLKVGDWVIGNEKASERYLQTIEGWKGQVTRIYESSFDAIGTCLDSTKTHFSNLMFECFDKLYQSSALELKEILKF